MAVRLIHWIRTRSDATQSFVVVGTLGLSVLAIALVIDMLT
jgi:hypothetical protein